MRFIHVLLTAAAALAVDAKSIKGSCSMYTINDDGHIRAICDGGWRWTRTVLDLNHCLYNDNSFLRFKKKSARPPPPSCPLW